MLLLVVACGDSSAPGTALDSGTVNRSDASVVDDTGDGDGDGDGDASEEHDASQQPDGVDPQSLLPLAVGTSWTYETDRPVIQESGPCTAGYTVELVGIAQVLGRSAYEAASSCSDKPTYYSVSDGGVDGYVSGAVQDFVPVIAAPVIEGATFQSNHLIFKWHELDSITVPAGTFHHCWERQHTNGTSPNSDTYCPGVGLVRSTRSTFAYVLTSYVIK